MSMFSDMAYEHVEEICKELKQNYEDDATLSEEELRAKKQALDDLIKRLPW